MKFSVPTVHKFVASRYVRHEIKKYSDLDLFVQGPFCILLA